MLLLYCQNGIMVCSHDDSQNVLASAYGDGTRVIPWPSGNLNELERVGELPPPEIMMGSNVDPRPFAQPAETPEILLGYAAQQRWEVSTQGVTFSPMSRAGSIEADTDRISQSLMSSLAQYAATLNRDDPISFTQNNASETITAGDAIDLFNQMLAQVQAARAIEAECISDLTSGSPTLKTYEDIEAKFTGARRKKA
jgi:hypothetical protein